MLDVYHSHPRNPMSASELRPPAARAAARHIVALAVLAALLGALHHLDHIARANHVGWPLTNQVTPFTFSLLVYPLLLGGAWFTARRAVSPWYWVLVSIAVAALLSWVHFGPDPRGEQMRDLYLPYAEPAAYCAHQSAAHPPVARSFLCDPASPPRPFLGALAVANMLSLTIILWWLVATSLRELLHDRQAREHAPPPTRRDS